MKLRHLMWIVSSVVTVALLILGATALWREVSPPSAAPGELKIVDEKPQPITFLTPASVTETVTLLTIVEPETELNLALPPALPDGMTVDDALTIATQTNPNAVVTEVRLQGERGVMLYRVAFSDRMQILIDARSGQILEMNSRGRGENPNPLLAQGVASAFAMPDAITIAADLYPGSTFERAELEEENGQLIYTIRMENGVELLLDANTGAYLYSKVDGERWVGELSLSESVRISVEQALQTALDLFPTTAVEEWELTLVDTQLAYDIELNNGFAVYVDATTGAVLETEQE